MVIALASRSASSTEEGWIEDREASGPYGLAGVRIPSPALGLSVFSGFEDDPERCFFHDLILLLCFSISFDLLSIQRVQFILFQSLKLDVALNGKPVRNQNVKVVLQGSIVRVHPCF